MAKALGPDGLEAWCVALAACFINFVMAGLGRMSGILFVAFIDIFHTDRLQASVPFSARSLTRNLLGPVVGIIGQKYGVRNATILGGIIGTISSALCFYPYNMLWITLFWGVFNGIGTALTITLPQAVLNLHFKKYKTTACGMAFSGGCVGSFIFPVLLEILLRVYGLGGTFLIMTGIIMNVIPAAMLLHKPTWMKAEAKNIQLQTNDAGASKRIINKTFNEIESIPSRTSERKFIRHHIAGKNTVHEGIRKNYLNEMCCSDSADKTFDKYMIDTELLRTSKSQVIQLLSEVFQSKHTNNLMEINKDSQFSVDSLYKELEDLCNNIEEIKNSDNFATTAAIESYHRHCSRIEHKADNRKVKNLKKSTYAFDNEGFCAGNFEQQKILPMLLSKLLKQESSKILDVFPENEHPFIYNILEQLIRVHNLLKDIECHRNSASSAPIENLFKDNNENCPKANIKDTNTFATHIKTAFSLHKNPLFLIISLCRSVHFLTFVPTITIIVDFSMDKGLLEEDGKFVIAALSLGDLLGRLCLGWVTDREYLSLPRYMLLVMILQGACTCSLPFLESKWILLLGLTLFGLLQGSLFVRHPVLVTRYLGKDQQSVAMGCFNFFSGILGFALPNYIGYFRDIIGAYDGMFFINGGIGMFVGLLWILEPIFVKWLELEKSETEESPP